MRNTLLVIGYHWPEPDSTAAGVRMMQLLEVFLNDGYAITFVSTATASEHSADLHALNIQTQQIELNNSSFDTFVTILNPKLVLFDRFLTEEQFGWRVVEHCPNALRILDTEDLHSLRHVREQAFKKDIPFTIHAWLQNDRTKREIASIYRCDLSLIISSYEMELLQEVVKIDKNLLLHLPFMVDEQDMAIDLPTFQERSDFIYVGGGKHSPNIDAIKWLKTEIWPKIREALPKAKLNIYGAYLPQQINEMQDPKTGFHVRGRAKTAKEVLLVSRVCLAPLRFGAGIKGKLLHAMQFGLPSITTKIGAEGMHDELDWNGTITDNTVDFAKAAVQLYTNSDTWTNAQKQGMKILNTIYSKSILKKILLKKIKTLQDTIIEHRNQNFIGSMLRHQTLNSTKFMAKWIAEKNNRI
ncbi:MAG: glycosyltransferase [Maribacter sp.]